MARDLTKTEALSAPDLVETTQALSCSHPKGGARGGWRETETNGRSDLTHATPMEKTCITVLLLPLDLQTAHPFSKVARVKCQLTKWLET